MLFSIVYTKLRPLNPVLPHLYDGVSIKTLISYNSFSRDFIPGKSFPLMEKVLFAIGWKAIPKPIDICFTV